MGPEGERTRDAIVSLSPADLFFFFFREMDARGIAKVPKVVPGPKLSIGLSASEISVLRSLLDEGRLNER